MLIKSGFPLRNVITISNEYMDAPSSKIDRMISIQSAICEEKTNTPLMKIKNSRRPMASIYK
jgi:hypothetical protein